MPLYCVSTWTTFWRYKADLLNVIKLITSCLFHQKPLTPFKCRIFQRRTSRGLNPHLNVYYLCWHSVYYQLHPICSFSAFPLVHVEKLHSCYTLVIYGLPFHLFRLDLHRVPPHQRTQVVWCSHILSYLAKKCKWLNISTLQSIYNKEGCKYFLLSLASFWTCLASTFESYFDIILTGVG